MTEYGLLANKRAPTDYNHSYFHLPMHFNVSLIDAPIEDTVAYNLQLVLYPLLIVDAKVVHVHSQLNNRIMLSNKI